MKTLTAGDEPAPAGPRTLVPLFTPDLSAFAKALRRQLAAALEQAPRPPGHVELLNMLARAAGHRNLQALRAAARARLPRPAPDSRPSSAPMPLSAHATRAAMHFDAQGRLVRWPHKFSVQRLAMWVLWMRFDAQRRYTEREVNGILRHWHTYGDHATLRRELVNMRLLSRRSDCSQYWKEPQRPADEVRALLHLVRQRAREAGAHETRPVRPGPAAGDPAAG
jgi:hypothetical protein